MPRAASSPVFTTYTVDYAQRPMVHMPPWGPLTALDVLLNNLALGLFMATALGVLLRPELFSAVAAPAFVLAWALLVLDLGLLVLDLGDPLRFHHMLRTVRPLSPMWVGVWGLSLSAACMTPPALWGVLQLPVIQGLLPGWVLSALNWLAASSFIQWLARALLCAGLLCASFGLLYKGVLFSATSRPLWRDARWFPTYLGSGALLLGGGALCALSGSAGSGPFASSLLPGLTALVVLDMLLLNFHLRPVLRDATRNMVPFLRLAVALDALAAICLAVAFVYPASLLLWAAFLCLLAAAALGRGCFILARKD